MKKCVEMNVIATYHCGLKEKFGIPRQSGIVEELPGEIVFEPEYRSIEAFRGIDSYSHLWLIWQFSQAVSESWSPTVRPPKLGGNTRMGVFATRSPFRPNNIGLSCVRLDRLVIDPRRGPVLYVMGADLLDGTPIFDIKPYIPYADSYPKANPGFSKSGEEIKANVVFEDGCLELIGEKDRAVITALLAQDPRPGYKKDGEKMYFMSYFDYDIGFKVVEKNIIVNKIIKK